MEDISHLKLRCPLCESVHTYRVAIDRDVIVAHMAPGSDIREVTRVFTRLSMCPNKDEQFQGNVRLTESALDPITRVAVDGLEEDD
jgi:hypothetical protein